MQKHQEISEEKVFGGVNKRYGIHHLHTCQVASQTREESLFFPLV
jgi:hypothetical protein